MSDLTKMFLIKKTHKISSTRLIVMQFDVLFLSITKMLYKVHVVINSTSSN